MGNTGIAGELRFFGLAVLRGVWILALYDLIRIFRRLIPHGVFWVAIEDLLYWVGTAFLIFSLLYRENDGAVRGYALFAITVGMVLYYWLLGSRIVEPVSRVLRAVLGTILKPFGILFHKVVQVTKMAVHFYKKKLKNKLKEIIIILFS